NLDPLLHAFAAAKIGKQNVTGADIALKFGQRVRTVLLQFALDEIVHEASVVLLLCEEIAFRVFIDDTDLDDRPNPGNDGAIEARKHLDCELNRSLFVIARVEIMHAKDAEKNSEQDECYARARPRL